MRKRKSLYLRLWFFDGFEDFGYIRLDYGYQQFYSLQLRFQFPGKVPVLILQRMATFRFGSSTVADPELGQGGTGDFI